MVRSISKEKYAIAAVITIGVFCLGLLLGLVIEGKRVNYVQSVGKEQSLDFNSLQIQYQYIDQLSKENDCEAVSKTFEQNVLSLESIRERLENYDKGSTLNKKDFELLKREYILAQLRYWLLAEKTKDLCGYDIVTILYFFSDEKECPKCNQQAFVLTHSKKIFKEKLLIFSFDSKYDQEPMIKILKNAYNLNVYPSLIINNQKYEGLVTNEDLLKMLCGLYKLKNEACEQI